MHVFVYGTLTEPERVGRLVDSFVFVGPATLEGLHPVQGRYPTLVPGGRTPGRLLRTDEMAALDTYEGVEEGLYTRVHVPLVDEDGFGPVENVAGDEADDTSGEAAVYVGDPERLEVDPDAVADASDATALWQGESVFAERIRRYIETHDVRVVVGERT